MLKKEYYTTGQAAYILSLSMATIMKLFDKGFLHGFRVPGSEHRRISRESILKIAEEYSIPIQSFRELK